MLQTPVLIERQRIGLRSVRLASLKAFFAGRLFAGFIRKYEANSKVLDDGLGPQRIRYERPTAI